MFKKDDPSTYEDSEKYREDVIAAHVLAHECSELFAQKELAVVGICMIRLMAKFVNLNPDSDPNDVMDSFKQAVLAVAQQERVAEARGTVETHDKQKMN